jgi:hypothetical protein
VRDLVWAPQAGPQKLLLSCAIEDVFFGGSRAGGKTDGLLGDAGTHVTQHPKHANAIIFRKTYKQMDEIIKRSLEIYPTMGLKYNAADYVWRHPKGGMIRLRYLDADADAEEYRGQNISWAGFDEAQLWPTPYAIDKIWGTMRSAHGVPVSRRLTGNPGGPGTVWLRNRYIHGREPLTPFKYRPDPDLPYEIEAVFIPSRLEDNKKLLEKDPHYEARLAAMTGGDKEMYQAERYGDWYVLKGAFFSSYREPECLFGSGVDLDPWLPRVLAIDWGFAHDSAVLWGAWDGRTMWVERELLVNKHTPVRLAERIVQMNNGQPLERIFLSHDAFGRRTSERTIAIEMGEVFRMAGLPLPTSSDRDRKGGLQVVQHMLGTGGLRVHESCRRLRDAIKTAQRDEKDPEDVMKWEGDDALDALLYLCRKSPGEIRVPEDVRIRQQLTAKDPHNLSMQRRIIGAQFQGATPGFVGRGSGPRWIRG